MGRHLPPLPPCSYAIALPCGGGDSPPAPERGAGRASRPRDEAVDHLLFAGSLEGDGELVALDAEDPAVAELLVKHPVAQAVGARGLGVGDGDQASLALDHPRPAGRSAGVAAGLRPLPARAVIAGAVVGLVPA